MDVQSFAQRLRQCRSRLGLTQMQLADMVGVKRGTLNNWEQGRSYPEVSQLIWLCKALGVKPEYLLDVETSMDPQPLLADARFALKNLESELQSCEPRRRRWVLDAIDRANRRISFLTEVVKTHGPAHRKKSPQTIPVLGSIRAGVPTLAEQVTEGEMVLPYEMQADYALRVKGDSMIGLGIYEGDVAICRRPGNDVPIGRIVVALVDNQDATLKVLVRNNGRWVLRAANPYYPDIIVNPANDVIQGVVTTVLRDVDKEINPDRLALLDLVAEDTGVPSRVIKAFLSAYNSVE